MNDTPTYPPLTKAEFDQGTGYTFHGVPLVEDENASYVFAYGHRGKTVMARAVNAYDRELMGGYPPGDQYTADDVQHCWAVTVQPPDGPDGWVISWASADKDTSGAFAVTVVNR